MMTMIRTSHYVFEPAKSGDWWILSRHGIFGLSHLTRSFDVGALDARFEWNKSAMAPLCALYMSL